MNRFIQWLKGVWRWKSGRKNHKLVVVMGQRGCPGESEALPIDSKCKDRCHCLCVYNEKNESDDDSGSDISISPTDIKVK